MFNKLFIKLRETMLIFWPFKNDTNRSLSRWICENSDLKSLRSSCLARLQNLRDMRKRKKEKKTNPVNVAERAEERSGAGWCLNAGRKQEEVGDVPGGWLSDGGRQSSAEEAGEQRCAPNLFVTQSHSLVFVSRCLVINRLRSVC